MGMEEGKQESWGKGGTGDELISKVFHRLNHWPEGPGGQGRGRKGTGDR